MTLFLTLQRFLVSFCLCVLFTNVVGFQGAHAATPKLAPEIAPKIDQSKVKMASPPPPLVFKKPPPQLAIVPAAKPGKVIGFELAGGVAPIQVTFDAGANSQYFSIARRSPMAKGGTLPARMSGTSHTLAGSDEIEGIRFDGFTGNMQLPGQIPVTVRLTDALGSAISATFSVIPVAPRLRIESLNTVRAAFPGGATTERLYVDGLVPGVSVGLNDNRLFTNLTVAETDCYFLTNGNSPIATADVSGSARLDVQGAFGVRRSSAVSSCTVAGEFTVFAGGAQVQPHNFFLKQGNIRISSAVRNKLGNTFALNIGLRFNPSAETRTDLGGTFGTCDGTSIGPQSYPVGILNNGDDLAFRIRSGPIGTGCEWRSVALEAPRGIKIVAMNWSVTEVGSKCCAGLKTNCDPDKTLNYIPSGAAPMVASPFDNYFTDDGGTAIANAINGGKKSYRSASEWGKSYFNPMTIRVRCDPTAVNDHGITVRLDSIEFEGPPGAKWPSPY